jgi:hypothetical protein
MAETASVLWSSVRLCGRPNAPTRPFALFQFAIGAGAALHARLLREIHIRGATGEFAEAIELTEKTPDREDVNGRGAGG